MTDETSPTPDSHPAAPNGTPTPDLPSAGLERARVDPGPAAKRRDALPVLYLVGFVILAASLIYLWKHPTLPRGAALEVARMDTLREQVNALQDRLGKLEARPAAAVPDLAPIQAQLAELSREAHAAPAGLVALTARVATLEARPAPPPAPDLAPLEARIGALEGRKPADLAPLESRIAALEAKPPVDLAPVQARIDAAARKETDDLRGIEARGSAAAAALSARLDALDTQGRQVADRLSAVAAKAQQAGRLQAASAALAAGQPVGDIPGAPPALAAFAHQAPPTEAGLRQGFEKAASTASAASLPALTDNQPLLSRMWTRAQQSVTVRQGEHVLVGDPIAGNIAAAREALDAGDLATAVKALDGLNAPAKAAMAGWVAQAKSLLDARAAIGEMAARS